MAIVELTTEQLFEAVRQLPLPQRKKLIQQLEHMPTPAKARRISRSLRGEYRMSTPDRKRLSELLLKGNSGSLSSRESKELERLAVEFEQRTLEMAQATARNVSSTTGRRPGINKRTV